MAKKPGYPRTEREFILSVQKYNVSQWEQLRRRVAAVDSAVARTFECERIPLTEKDGRRLTGPEMLALVDRRRSARARWAWEAWRLANTARESIGHAQKAVERGDFLSIAFTAPLTQAENFIVEAERNLLMIDAIEGRAVRRGREQRWEDYPRSAVARQNAEIRAEYRRWLSGEWKTFVAADDTPNSRCWSQKRFYDRAHIASRFQRSYCQVKRVLDADATLIQRKRVLDAEVRRVRS